jgi:hypothetical protein
MLNKIIASICAIIPTFLSAAQYIPMDQAEVITVNLSARNHNRIGIVGDRIRKAFFRSSDVSVDVEEATGQIFIQAVRPNCPNTTISIVSLSGAVQDLDLCFMDGPSEIVILRHCVALPDPSLTKSPEICDSPYIESKGASITDLVEGFIKGIIPQGYMSIEDTDKPIPIKKGLKLQRLSRLVSKEQIIFVYRLQNDSACPQSIKECQVNILDGDWVFLDRYELSQNESALVLIGCSR